MNLAKRLLGSIYKNYLSVSVEYHGGGYFVRKRVSYLFFESEYKVRMLVREEGLHPNDDNYNLLLENLKLTTESLTFSIAFLNKEQTIIVLNNQELLEFYCVPSVFSESATEKKITEILLDDRREQCQRCYSLVEIRN